MYLFVLNNYFPNLEYCETLFCIFHLEMIWKSLRGRFGKHSDMTWKSFGSITDVLRFCSNTQNCNSEIPNNDFQIITRKVQVYLGVLHTGCAIP